MKRSQRVPVDADRRLVTFNRAIPPVHRVASPLARRFAQICTAAVAEALEGHEVTPLEFGVLRYLDEEPDIDQSALAARLGVDRNNASLLVERLETKGHIERRVNGQDRRARLLRLTSRGANLQDQLRKKTTVAQQRVLSVLGVSERELLLDLLVRVVEGNRVLARPGAGRRKRGSVKSTISEK